MGKLYYKAATAMEITIKNMSYEEEEQGGTFQNITHQQNANLARLKQLEGECKVHSFRPLQFDCLKTAILIIPLVLSFVGLLLLKYFKSFRVKCFYKDCPHEDATYFFIQSLDGHAEIEDVIRQNNHIFVYFKSLKYSFTNGNLIPVGFLFEESFEELASSSYLARGLGSEAIGLRAGQFGRNEHTVEIPHYLEYMFDILTKPFFLFQYAVCIIYIFQRYFVYIALYLGFSFVTTTINYILLYRSYTKIKDMAERQTDVTVIRNGNTTTVKNHDLVPGDVVIPARNEEISYDGILIAGQMFVNEASLTGESIPVGKFPTNSLADTKKDTVWIVEGSKVLETREESRVVVVNTGYATRRGRIIRKILTRVPRVADFFRSGVYFLTETLVVGVVIYACQVNMMYVNGISALYIVFRFLDVLVWSFPPSFPIYFNVANSFSLIRLKWRGIFGTEPEKATEAANIKTFCFDKTGTLTQNEIEVYEVIKFTADAAHANITDTLRTPENSLIHKLFASCHTARQSDTGLLGDEVDVRMFLYSEFSMAPSSDPRVRFVVEGHGEKVEVLKINQFESKFQNMSVLVRDVVQKKCYVFVKGAPERIDKNSKIKYKQFETLVANLSLGGYRTIAYGYKLLEETEIARYMDADREIFEKDIIALGLVAFENKLKGDTRETIAKLIDSDIEPKMITGDNIFIAVETGFRAGILKADEKVVLLEGRKQTEHSRGAYDGTLLYKKDGEIVQQKIKITTQEYETTDQYAFALDNDFLSLKPEPPLTNTAKLFARISPESKALIVKKFKQQYEVAFSMMGSFDRVFGGEKWKVGMCGDGANDLMAIREADVGVGISESDASYGASFTIALLADVDYIVRESKNTCQSIIDVIRYFGTVNFLKIITSIILASDVTFFTSNQILYFNFAHTLLLALFLTLSGTADAPTKMRPKTNSMSLQNHVVYWSNVIFPTIGFFGAYYYLYTRSEFVSNPDPSMDSAGYKSLSTHTTTIVWLLINLPLTFNVFTIYRSAPFKCQFHQNIPLLVLTVLNMVAAIAFFFITSRLKMFSLVTLTAGTSGVCLLIMCCTLIAAYAANAIYQRVSE